jgi:hypothetical protein
VYTPNSIKTKCLDKRDKLKTAVEVGMKQCNSTGSHLRASVHKMAEVHENN